MSRVAARTRADSRPRALFELAVAYAAIQIALWTSDTTRAIAMAAAVVWMFGAVLLERTSASELGLGKRGLGASLWIVGTALLVLGVMVLLARLSGSLHGLAGEPLWVRIPAYIPWAFAQQFVAQCFFFRRLEAVLRDGIFAVLATAVLFAGAHLPNPVLVPATLVAEFLWTLAYRRYRNLYAISVAHALLAVAVMVSVPEPWHHFMRVGIGYLRYRPS